MNRILTFSWYILGMFIDATLGTLKVVNRGGKQYKMGIMTYVVVSDTKDFISRFLNLLFIKAHSSEAGS